MTNIIQDIELFPRNINVKEFSKGLDIFETVVETEIKPAQAKFLQKFILYSNTSQGVSLQILKSWVSANVSKDSEFNLDFTHDFTLELIDFYYGKRLEYLGNFVDLVVDSETEIMKEFIENGFLENLLKDFKNGMQRLSANNGVQEDVKWEEYLVRELVMIVKVMIAFLYDTCLFADTSRLFFDFTSKFNSSEL